MSKKRHRAGKLSIKKKKKMKTWVKNKQHTKDPKEHIKSSVKVSEMNIIQALVLVITLMTVFHNSQQSKAWVDIFIFLE